MVSRPYGIIIKVAIIIEEVSMIRLNIKSTKRCELIDITKDAVAAIRETGVKDGAAIIYCPHTTAGITINEAADPSVAEDISSKTGKLIEHRDTDYRHSEGNSDAHIKSSLVGSSVTVIINSGKLALGTWQGIFFAEFDGPRSRETYVKVIEG